MTDKSDIQTDKQQSLKLNQGNTNQALPPLNTHFESLSEIEEREQRTFKRRQDFQARQKEQASQKNNEPKKTPAKNPLYLNKRELNYVLPAKPIMQTQLAKPIMQTQLANPIMQTQLAKPIMQTQLANKIEEPTTAVLTEEKLDNIQGNIQHEERKSITVNDMPTMCGSLTMNLIRLKKMMDNGTNNESAGKDTTYSSIVDAYTDELTEEEEDKSQKILKDKLNENEGTSLLPINSDTGTPFNQEEILRIKKWFADNPNQKKYKRSKAKNGFPVLSILKITDHENKDAYMIIYRGKKPNTYKINKENQYYKTFLGKGAYGRVKLAQNLDTAKVVAAKIVFSTSQEEVKPLQKIMEEETENLKSLQEFHGIADRCITSNKKKQYLFMDFKEGVALCDYLMNNQNDDLKKLQAILAVLIAIKKLHDEHQIIHGDLNATNALYNEENNTAYIIDQGCARVADANGMVKFHGLTRSYYNAPESSTENKLYYSSDYYNLTNQLLFVSKPPYDINFIDDSGTKQQLNLIFKKMSSAQPNQRLPIEQAIQKLENLISSVQQKQSIKTKSTNNPAPLPSRAKQYLMPFNKKP